MHSALPVLHLLPCERGQGAAGAPGDSDSTTGSRAVLACPLYKTRARAGVVDSLGHSTNFVMHLPLPIPAGTTAHEWLMLGVAAVCSLDD
jgi:dynein heavy chain